MPCDHKFLNDLTLDYVDWEVRTLFIGTFNPGWYSPNNKANWFYGRPRNSFWCILPTIYQHASLIKGERNLLINFCRINHLAITDIITCLDNAYENNPIHTSIISKFKDEDLAKFTSTRTDIIDVLERFSLIRQICFTAINLPADLEIQVDAIRNWLNQHPERDISFRYLYSPNNQARRGIVGNTCTGKADKWVQQGYQIL